MLKKFSFVVLAATTLVAYESTVGQSHTAPNIVYCDIDAVEAENTSEALAETVEEPCIISRFDPIINDTETNVRLAGMLLSELDTMLRMPASTPVEDRLSIILASYNAGIGHVMDARRLARSEGANPNSWEAIRYYLDLKSDPEYYELDIVKSGRFTGSRQTEGYVNEVMRKYRQYCALAS